RQQRARISDYMHWLGKRQVPVSFSDYPSLWQWSVEQPEVFWQSIWDYFEVESPTPASQVLSHTNMLDARWFEGSQVNYTRQVFRHSRTDRPAILFADENGARQSLSWGALQQQVASLAFHLRELGVVAGDRV
ncbi:acetoacetate--CoA ligase, partial [Pseudomonas aeruginosa]|nr:acetoacetate--CoA ligase [Pseudomonas aeruginosa]